MRPGFGRRLAALLAAGAVAAPASATWSVVAADVETQEVIVGSATCVTNLDLREFLPVVVVGVGAAAVQSLVDSNGVRRMTIHEGFLGGLNSEEILEILEGLPGAPLHQYGIADVSGHSATFTGSSNGAHASGVTGVTGQTVFYAIQGNVLTGKPVVAMAEEAFVTTEGDLPARLMAAMEAARSMGGDGRCSCEPGDPTGCGSPPANFEKSAHIGFVIVSRFGDLDDPECNAGGCADGDYFLNLNVPFQSEIDPDPVIQLQGLFAAWRADLEGRPDAVQTGVEFLRQGFDFVLRLEVRDWQGMVVTSGIRAVTVEHAPDSAQVTTIGEILDLGNGVFEVLLTRGPGVGVDRFLVTIDDGVRPVVLPPNRTLLDLNPLFSDGFETGDLSAWDETAGSG